LSVRLASLDFPRDSPTRFLSYNTITSLGNTTVILYILSLISNFAN
jgi:hypothetical protein